MAELADARDLGSRSRTFGSGGSTPPFRTKICDQEILSRANEVSRGMTLPAFPRGWYCYLLLCADAAYYCGITTDLGQRIRDHASGKGSQYTKGNHPVALVWYQRHDDRRSAARRESQLKKWSHRKKRELADGRLQLGPKATAGWVSLD